MSGKYYWVKTKEGEEIEIGYQRKSGQWELCGIDVLRDVTPIITEVIGEVSEWCSDENETALHKHGVTTRFSFINFMLGFMVGGIFCLAILYLTL